MQRSAEQRMVRVGQDWWSRFLATCLVKALGKLLAKNAGRCAGAESEKRFFKSKTTFLPNLI
jgi:hypothetical protein